MPHPSVLSVKGAHPLVGILRLATQIRKCDDTFAGGCDLCRERTRMYVLNKQREFNLAYARKFLRPTICCWEITDEGVNFMMQLRGDF